MTDPFKPLATEDLVRGHEAGTCYNPFLYDATVAQLEKWLLTAVVVAGKQARTQQAKLDHFLEEQLKGWRRDFPKWNPSPTPFELIRDYTMYLGRLRCELEYVRMGQYTRITNSFRELVRSGLDLRTCTREDLVRIPGIGMKSASFFILFSRRKAQVSCLDTHILQWMADQGWPDIPRATPPLRRYLELEARFIEYCHRHGRDIAEMDFSIWKARNHGDRPRKSK